MRALWRPAPLKDARPTGVCTFVRRDPFSGFFIQLDGPQGHWHSLTVAVRRGLKCRSVVQGRVLSWRRAGSTSTPVRMPLPNRDRKGAGHHKACMRSRYALD